jgi:protein TonB
VKRLLPCIILALAFHAAVLSSDFSWLRLAPIAKPAAKSLTITLSANKIPRSRAQAVVSDKAPHRQLETRFNQKPGINPDAMSTPAQAEHSAKRQKPAPTTTPPKKNWKKARRKISLKALTYKKQQKKTIEAARTASSPKPHVPLRVETKIFGTASSSPESGRHQRPAQTTFIKKTQHVPDGSPEPATTAAMQPATQSDDTLPGAVLKLALPLYKQNEPPLYPLKARRLGYEGIVMLKVLIDDNGRVDDLRVLKSSGHRVLDRAALSAVKKWLFEPGTENGVKKKMWVKIPVRFDLK